MAVWGSIISWNFRETLTLTVLYCDIATHNKVLIVECTNIALSIYRVFLDSSPVSARHGVLFVNAKSGRSCIIVSVILCVISCYRWPQHIESLEYIEMSYYVLNIIRHMDTCNMTSFVFIFNLEEQTFKQWIRFVNRVSWQDFMSTPYTTK